LSQTTPPQFDILGIGTAAVDDFLYVDRYPPADEKEPVRDTSRQCGGQIASALAAAARLGARCAGAGVLGHDDLSAYMERSLRDAGIDCSRIVHDPQAGPIYSVIIVDDKTHTRNIFFNRRLIKSLPPTSVTRGLVTSAKVLLIDQFGSDEMIEAAQHAGHLGLPVVADMEWPDRPRMRELMERVDHLIVPRDFARTTTQCQEVGQMVLALHRIQPRMCPAVTHGAEGCYFIAGADSRTVRHQPAFPVKTAETTGCGDVFHGAYATALAEGSTIESCVRFASAAAAAYAARPSGWQYLPDRANVLAILDTMESAS